MIDNTAFWFFILSATALLGSPGPAIAALVAIGRAEGFMHGLRFFTGLQFGLAIAAGISAAGLFSLLQLVPALLQVVTIAAVIYLLWLAWKIASSPTGATDGKKGAASSFAGGLFLGLSNPKAFVAFVSLFASQTIVVGSPHGDSAVKWCAIVAVMVVVDMAWLSVGAGLRKARFSPRAERALNITLGAAIVVATLFSMW